MVRRVEAAFSILRQMGVEEPECSYVSMDVFERARGRPSTVGVRDEHRLLQVFALEHLDDVSNVGVESDLIAEKVGSLAESGERQRDDVMTVCSEEVGRGSPTPGAMPGTMHENKRSRAHRTCFGVQVRFRVRLWLGGTPASSSSRRGGRVRQ